MFQIISAPNEVLSQQAKPVPIRSGEVTKIDGSLHNLIEEMNETLAATTDPEGVGLAAPQIGRSLQLFIIKPTPKSKEQIFINPKVTLIETNELNSPPVQNEPKKTKEDTKLEGCLSLPAIWGEVKRAPQVLVEYLDEQGKPHTQTFSGFPAIIIQHEYDHLNGILFPKRVLEQNNKLYKSHKEKGKDVFEEIEL